MTISTRLETSVVPDPESFYAGWTDSLELARAHVQRRCWPDAITCFVAAGGFDELLPADAERLAWSVTWAGQPSAACLDAFERCELAYRRIGDASGVARAALEQARMHALAGDAVVAAACWQRAVDAVRDTDAVELTRAFALAGYERLVAGDLSAARDLADQASARTGSSSCDRTTEALALYIGSQVETLVGDCLAGLAGLDRAASLVVSGTVDAMYGGLIYCGVLWTCQQIGDWGRAAQWDAVAQRWCERERITHFPAHLAARRSELERVRGHFKRAKELANEALEEAGDWSRDLIGWAHHQVGEACLAAGGLEAAADAFDRAEGVGYTPEPGRARLLLARDDPAAAEWHIERAIARSNWYGQTSLIGVLAAGVSVAIAAGATDRAAERAAGLAALAERFGTRRARGAASGGRGEVALARGEPARARDHLADAVAECARDNAPFDAACARVNLGRALEQLGRHDAAAQEVARAHASFVEIGASWDVARTERLLSDMATGRRAGRASDTSDGAVFDGLTRRQVEVAALVGRGFSNNEIAVELTISRLTAETHVRNILTALGASSRSQIASWATSKGLVTSDHAPRRLENR